MLNILYIGLASGTSLDRANAYRRLGHRVTHIDTRTLLPASKLIDVITWKVGDNWLKTPVRLRLQSWISDKRFNLCHIDSGEWLCGETIRMLKRHCDLVINYNIDDPTGYRDRRRFNCYRDAVSEYDLLCVVRDENVSEVRKLGARHVLRLFRTADEVSHAPRVITNDERRTLHSDVLFIGTWMPERGPFLLKLTQLGVPLSIRGAHWHKAPEWEELKPFWKGGHLEGDDYAKVIQCAAVNIGLVSEGNRDRHTTRSSEIPALGALLCAKRTDEHILMYQENSEILLWSTAEECAEKCLMALRDDRIRRSISKAGQVRCHASGYFNETACKKILREALL